MGEALGLPLLERFSCTRCGHCCTMLNCGPPLFWSDVTRLADRLGVRKRSFLEDSCEVWREPELDNRSGPTTPMIHLRLRGRTCVLYDPAVGCTVQEVKPMRCKHAPYISLLVRERDSAQAAADACPGIGQGSKTPAATVRRCLEDEQREELRDYSRLQDPQVLGLIDGLALPAPAD